MSRHKTLWRWYFKIFLKYSIWECRGSTIQNLFGDIWRIQPHISGDSISPPGSACRNWEEPCTCGVFSGDVGIRKPCIAQNGCEDYKKLSAWRVTWTVESSGQMLVPMFLMTHVESPLVPACWVWFLGPVITNHGEGPRLCLRPHFCFCFCSWTQLYCRFSLVDWGAFLGLCDLDSCTCYSWDGVKLLPNILLWHTMILWAALFP